MNFPIGHKLLYCAIGLAIVLLVVLQHLPATEHLFHKDKVHIGGSEPKEIVIGHGKYEIAMPLGDTFEDVHHGKEEWFAIASLAGIDQEYPANGVAQAHLYEDRLYRVAIRLNIEQGDGDQFYEAWLESEDGSKSISLGHLRSRFADVRHFTEYEIKRDLRNMPIVRVTLEQDDGDPAQSDVILAQGYLKYRQR